MFKKIKAYLAYLKDEREQQKEFSIYHNNNKLNFFIYFLIIFLGPLLYYFIPSFIIAWTFGYLAAIVMTDILNRR